jgi:pimeloyl-ACP methyl ester carboxylesterase
MSLGGKVGLTLAAEQPPGLRALVVVDTGPNTQEIGRARLATFAAPREFASLDEAVEEALRFNPRRDRDGLRRSLLRNLRPTADGKWSWKWDPARVTSETLQQQRDTEKRDLALGIPRITCPTLVVRGADSDIFSADDAAHLISKLQFGELVTIEGAGHTVQGDKPVELASAIRTLMAELELR